MAASLSSARVLRTLAALSTLFPLVQACGARSDTEDYVYGSDGTISVGNSASTAGRNTGGTPTPGGRGPSIAGVGNIAGRSMGGASAIGGSGIIEGGEPSVGGRVGVAGGGVGGIGVAGAPAGGAPAGSPITCGDEVCDADTESCCLTGDFACVAKGSACSGVALGCTTAADCAGNGVCCISLTGNPGDASACKPSCDNRGPGRDRQLCTSDADCTGRFRYCRALVFGVSMCVFLP